MHRGLARAAGAARCITAGRCTWREFRQCGKTIRRTRPRRGRSCRRWKTGSGEVFNSVRLLANHPRQATALLDFVRSVRHHNSLTPTLTELVYTTATVINQCHY